MQITCFKNLKEGYCHGQQWVTRTKKYNDSDDSCTVMLKNKNKID